VVVSRGVLIPQLVAIAVCQGCRGPASAPSSDQPSKVATMPSPSHPAATPQLLVGPPSVIPWAGLPSAQIVDVGPPVGSAIEIPGPQTRPVRPHLELTASPAGVAARVVQGDGAVAAVAVLGDEPIAIEAGALAVSARSDGLWVMYRDRLLHHDRQGAVRHRVVLSGVSLLGGTHDAVWLIGANQAWQVDSRGAVRGPWPWRSPLSSFVVDGNLCLRDQATPRSLSCISAAGAGGEVATSQLPFDLEPLEQPVYLADDLTITLQGTTVRVRRGAELLGAWTLQVAGVDTAKRAFVISATSEQRTLWRQPENASAGLAVPARQFAHAGTGSLSAASIAGDTIVLYGQGQTSTYRGSAAAELATIDEPTYRSAIFPTSWQLTAVRGIAVHDGAVVVAASGPEGAALIRLTLGL
jgi:hypothetical protein